MDKLVKSFTLNNTTFYYERNKAKRRIERILGRKVRKEKIADAYKEARKKVGGNIGIFHEVIADCLNVPPEEILSWDEKTFYENLKQLQLFQARVKAFERIIDEIYKSWGKKRKTQPYGEKDIFYRKEGEAYVLREREMIAEILSSLPVSEYGKLLKKLRIREKERRVEVLKEIEGPYISASSVRDLQKKYGGGIRWWRKKLEEKEITILGKGERIVRILNYLTRKYNKPTITLTPKEFLTLWEKSGWREVKKGVFLYLMENLAKEGYIITLSFNEEKEKLLYYLHREKGTQITSREELKTLVAEFFPYLQGYLKILFINTFTRELEKRGWVVLLSERRRRMYVEVVEHAKAHGNTITVEELMRIKKRYIPFNSSSRQLRAKEVLEKLGITLISDPTEYILSHTHGKDNGKIIVEEKLVKEIARRKGLSFKKLKEKIEEESRRRFHKDIVFI